MTVQGIWSLVRSHWLILLLTTLLGAFAGLGIAASSAVSYTSRAEVFVAVNDGGTSSDLSQGADYSQVQARNFAAVVTRELVLQAVIDDLDLGLTSSQLRGRIRTSVPLDTSIISISVTDGSPERAAEIADSVAANLANVVEQLVPASVDGRPPVRILALERATVPGAPSAPQPSLLVIVGALAGLCVGVLLAALRAAAHAPERSTQVSGPRDDE